MPIFRRKQNEQLVRSSKPGPALDGEKSIHQHLSELQSAYSIFLPKPEEFFPLFQIITLHPDRPKSPRNTTANLGKIFQRIEGTEQSGFDESVMRQFLEEFGDVSSKTASQTTTCIEVSEESLRAAGLKISEPNVGIGIGGSRARTTHRQLRMSPISSAFYVGGVLKDLVWDHADDVFFLILKQLGTQLGVQRRDKSLLGIVTRRMVSTIDVLGIEKKETDAQGGVAVHGIGITGFFRRRRRGQQAFRDLKGVSGLHFIVFPVEYIERHEWRLYRGIDVCDSEQDEDVDADVLQRDNLYQATRWLCGNGHLNHADGSDCKTIRTLRNDEAATQQVPYRVTQVQSVPIPP